MTFTLEQMITALRKSGYEVREEHETVAVFGPGRYEQEVEQTVWNVYRHGEKVVDWGPTGGFRVKFVFEQELCRKMLELF